MNLLITFIIISIINVIASTIRSILTIKGNKFTASLSNALYFAYYNIVLIYTVSDFPMWEKCLVTFTANLIGVYIVKYFEEKSKKDKLWKIEVNVNNKDRLELENLLDRSCLNSVSYNYIETSKGDYTFNFFCKTQEDSQLVRDLTKKLHSAKFFVTETKSL